MGKMVVQAIKLTEDLASIQVAYVRNGKVYIRSGADGFKSGVPVHGGVRSLLKHGFKALEDPCPMFSDGDEILANIKKFQFSGNEMKFYQ